MSEKPTVPAEVQESPVNWPSDLKGKPMAQVSWSMHELINLGNYSNVTIGPVRVTRFVLDRQVDKGLKQCKEDVESSLAEEREQILNVINAQKAGQ